MADGSGAVAAQTGDDDPLSSVESMLELWRAVVATARRRERWLGAGYADKPTENRISTELIALRPVSLTDERLVEQAGAKNALYQLRRHVWPKLEAEEVDQRFLEAFRDPLVLSDLLRGLRAAKRTKTALETPATAALKKLAPVPEAMRGRLAGLLRQVETVGAPRVETVLESAAALAAIEQALNGGREQEASEIAWWHAWRANDPYFITVACALTPALRAGFATAPPAQCGRSLLFDRSWMVVLADLGRVLVQTGDRFAPGEVLVLGQTLGAVFESLDDIGNVATAIVELTAVAEKLATALPGEDGELLSVLADPRAPVPEAVRLTALGYGLLGLEHAEAQRQHAERKAFLKRDAAKALESERYEAAADISRQLAALPPPPPALYRERLVALRAMHERAEQHFILPPEPPPPAAPPPAKAPSASAQRLAAMETALAEAQAQRAAAEAEAASQAALAREAWLEVHRLRREAGAEDDAPTAVRPRPTALTEIPDWVETALDGRLVLHARAVRGLKKAVFEDVGLIVDVLETLAGPYRDAKMPGRCEEAKAVLDARCAALGVEISPTITASNKGASDPQLWINHEGRPYQLDLHVKRGIAKDRRVLLRVYFAWDEDEHRVVVGHLPDHIVDKNSR